MNAGQPATVEVNLQIATDTQGEICPDHADFAAWVAAALSAQEHGDMPASGVIGIRIVSPQESAALNNNYRGKDAPTNILAFPAGPSLLPDTEPDEPELGDLVLCLRVARDEADEQGKTLTQHMAHLTVHGTLHLLGYDHTDDADADRMESLERSILGRLGMPDPYRIDAT